MQDGDALEQPLCDEEVAEDLFARCVGGGDDAGLAVIREAIDVAFGVGEGVHASERVESKAFGTAGWIGHAGATPQDVECVAGIAAAGVHAVGDGVVGPELGNRRARDMRNGRCAQHYRRTGDGKQTEDGGAEVHAGLFIEPFPNQYNRLSNNVCQN